MAESEEELKSLLMRVKEESERANLRAKNIKRKIKIMSSTPLLHAKIVEVVTAFLFLGFKITADSDCSHEIRRQFLLGRKAMKDLDSVLKSRDITADKGLYSQGYGLPSGHIRL